jgi:hypothetical protein
MEAALYLLILPLFLLNFAGLVGGAWLLGLGQWKIVVAYGLGSLVATFFLGIFLLPSAGLSALSGVLLQRKWRFLAWILASANIIYCALVIATWCFGMFSEIVSLHEAGPLLPYLLFGYGVTVGPWTYLASNDSDGSMLIVFFAVIGVVAMMVVREFALGVSLLLAFGLPLVAGVILQITVGLIGLLSIPLDENLRHG